MNIYLTLDYNTNEYKNDSTYLSHREVKKQNHIV